MSEPLELLRGMAIFGALNDDTLRLILDGSETVEVAAGESFFQEGDRATALYVLQSGSVVVERHWQDSSIVLGRLKRGDCVGEMSLIDMQPRSASVRALEDCRAMKIVFAMLHRLYKQELEQYAMIMMNLGREVSRRLRLADEHLLQLQQEYQQLQSRLTEAAVWREKPAV